MGTVYPFPSATLGRPRADASTQTSFTRAELFRIIDLYGRMVAAGLWKDYSIEFGREAATFHAYRRAAERAEYRIEKRPALRGRQGMWALIGEHDIVVKRGHELGPVLASIERRLMKVIND